jgi:hypothetical protein
MKQPWWLTVGQWIIITFLTLEAGHNSLTNHGFQMAINCFCLGFVAFSLAMRPIIASQTQRMHAVMKEMEIARDLANLAAAELQKAINQGRIEFIPMQPGDDNDKPTRH